MESKWRRGNRNTVRISVNNNGSVWESVHHHPHLPPQSEHQCIRSWSRGEVWTSGGWREVSRHQRVQFWAPRGLLVQFWRLTPTQLRTLAQTSGRSRRRNVDADKRDISSASGTPARSPGPKINWIRLCCSYLLSLLLTVPHKDLAAPPQRFFLLYSL